MSANFVLFGCFDLRSQVGELRSAGSVVKLTQLHHLTLQRPYLVNSDAKRLKLSERPFQPYYGLLRKSPHRPFVGFLLCLPYCAVSQYPMYRSKSNRALRSPPSPPLRMPS